MNLGSKRLVFKFIVSDIFESVFVFFLFFDMHHICEWTFNFYV